MNPWPADRLDQLVDLVAAALPGEHLQAAELHRLLFDDPDPSVVLGDERVAVAAVVRTLGGARFGFVRLLVVHPDARRAGRGRAALGAAHDWLLEQGVVEVHAHGSAPFYLWPGVDVAWTPALCLLEAAGYTPTGLALNMGCPSGFRAPVPAGVHLARVGPDSAGRVERWCAAAFPPWVPELARASALGTAFLAQRARDGAVLGFACHGTNRPGWFGPIGTDPSCRGTGVGAALLAACCEDVAATGAAQLEISWVGPVRFYAKVAGARVSRAFVTAVWRPTSV